MLIMEENNKSICTIEVGVWEASGFGNTQLIFRGHSLISN